jgi:hypothetical protein
MVQDGYDNFSIFVEDLIRKRWEQHETQAATAPSVMHDAPAPKTGGLPGKRKTA